MKHFAIHTFGCQMNVHDSRRIEEVLRHEGMTPTEDVSSADLVIINTCSVRHKAEHKLMSMLGTLRPLKARPGVVLAVAGCVAQQEGERLIESAPFVDLVFGPDNIAELPQLLKATQSSGASVVHTEFDLEDPTFLNATPHEGEKELSAYVTVMKGCDERCTFCIVPYTRGSERYRSSDEIVAEIRGLVAGGVQEITLLGQTVNSWFDPNALHIKPRSKQDESRSQFAELLTRIANEVPSLKRLRYTSPHPRHVNDALVDAHRSLDMLARHVHLPVQSGSDAVLKRMSRRYTSAEYIERARNLQHARPDLTLSTDIIVGFPGETDEDFEQTMRLVEEVGFVAAYCFKYSPRPYTPALQLGDDVPESIKDDRLQRLFELVEWQQSAHLKSLLAPSNMCWSKAKSWRCWIGLWGRTERNEIVHLDVSAGVDPVGREITVQVTHAFAHSLLAEAIGVRRGEGAEKLGLRVVGNLVHQHLAGPMGVAIGYMASDLLRFVV
ncbi:MAG: tRNA (N6-isopentenyl adenosine(37)-C2)-methylthiotransferase MiaB [Polyangiales bacterium]